jgi:purine-nucleoside phosphorylase
VLGTGLGEIADRLEDRWSIAAAETDWLAASTATGHAGRLVWGQLGGSAVVLLQGRVHAYEGFPAETLTRGVELLAALGAETLLVTNASGGLRPEMQSGELLVIDDHLDFVSRDWSAAVTANAGGFSVRRRGGWYDAALNAKAIEALRRAALPARVGTYAYLLGPSYETRSEYRMLRRIGADAVGMSTVPEVVAAASLGMRVAAVSVITNVARPDALAATDAEEVCRLAGDAAEGVWAVLQAFAEREDSNG